VKQLPRGNAGVGNIKFDLAADPAAQQVTVDGTDKRKATIDKFEVWFRRRTATSSASRARRKTWRLVVTIDKVDDSRKYMYFEGDCKLL
jgi:hypothetical protein